MRKVLLGVIAMTTLVAPWGARASFDGCTWGSYGNGSAHSFAQTAACTSVSRLTVSSLRPKWSYPTQDPVTAQPAVGFGRIYVGAADGTFYAFKTDPTPGPVEPDWTFSVHDANKADYGKIVSSAALATVDGTHVVIFGGASTLYVLNADTGAELASSCFDPRATNRCAGSTQTIEIESSPSVIQDADGTHIVIGMDFNEDPNVGRAGVVGLDLTSSPWNLDAKWKFDPERQVTYTTDTSKTGATGFEVTSNVYTAPSGSAHAGQGCGNVWSSVAIDTTLDLAFFGIGNCGKNVPSPAFGEAIFAVHVSDGGKAWRYAPRPDNDLDLDFGSSTQLLPGSLVGEGGKDGVYYALDRATGTVGWTSKVAAASDIGGMIGSAALGKVNGADAIFASSAVPISTRTGPDPDMFMDPRTGTALRAFSATTGELLWSAPTPLPAYGAAVYANGVVFLPDTFGFSIQAYDADTGALLWASPLNGAPSSAPAIVGDSIYLGTGTAADPVPFVGTASGIWAFQVTAPSL